MPSIFAYNDFSAVSSPHYLCLVTERVAERPAVNISKNVLLGWPACSLVEH